MPYDAAPGRARAAPTATQLRHLRATNRAGGLHVALAAVATATGLAPLVLGLDWPAYLVGQLILAAAFVLWFVIQHEAGHGTLFKNHRLNQLAGHTSSLVVLIPFTSWKSIHRLHHKWTGWQDLDPTTAALVPRALQPVERFAINLAWRTGLPLFSLLYRRNFWSPAALARWLPPGHARACKRNIALQLALYLTAATAISSVAGPVTLLLAFGPALFLGLALMDPIMLSQHTHVPLRVAGGERVKPIKAKGQDVYTRSLAAPRLLSRWLLLGFDFHELHHVYPQVPGHRLREIERATPNRFNWWTWLRRAKQLPGETFLFSNRDRTGADI